MGTRLSRVPSLYLYRFFENDPPPIQCRDDGSGNGVIICTFSPFRQPVSVTCVNLTLVILIRHALRVVLLWLHVSCGKQSRSFPSCNLTPPCLAASMPALWQQQLVATTARRRLHRVFVSRFLVFAASTSQLEICVSIHLHYSTRTASPRAFMALSTVA
jgi:hypothetical protein